MTGARRPDPQKGVFETMLVLDGHPVELEAHLSRLKASLAEVYPGRRPPDFGELDVPVERGPYGYLSSGMSEPSCLRITVAPGDDGELETRIEQPEASSGSATAVHCLAVSGGLGAHKWADRSLLDEAQARLPANSLPLLVDDDGSVLEASRANVFGVRDGALFTPPLDGRILPGVTRMRVLEIAAATDLESKEIELGRNDLLAADEVFLTGSVRGIEPTASIDGVPLATGGPVTTRLATALRRAWLGTPVG